ncbi:DUF6482 family protein [Agarivorans sp. Alg241-V36]|uniref:DUF6482 family protein n=1 Tax=Agarivorans sp. Alg241-V36 TaxID=2305992 RepID=UPI0013D2B341|nr:DUF6482 family protein [Agarivorans sp. Alg241-V36]
MDLIINSHEGDIYLVNEQQHNFQRVLCDSNHHPLRFASISSIKQHYQEQAIDKVWLVQHSAYDEMCGLQSANQPMKMPLSW